MRCDLVGKPANWGAASGWNILCAEDDEWILLATLLLLRATERSVVSPGQSAFPVSVASCRFRCQGLSMFWAPLCAPQLAGWHTIASQWLPEYSLSRSRWSVCPRLSRGFGTVGISPDGLDALMKLVWVSGSCCVTWQSIRIRERYADRCGRRRRGIDWGACAGEWQYFVLSSRWFGCGIEGARCLP